MRARWLSPTLVLIAAFPATLAAAPATPEGAQAIAQSYVAFLGRAVVDKGIVAVTPSGEDYIVTWNFQKAFDLTGKPNAKLRIDPLVYTLTLREGGGWRVKADHMPRLAFDLPTRQGRVNGAVDLGDLHVDTLFDPARQEFLRAVGATDALNVKARVSDPGQQSDLDLTESGVSAEARAQPARGGAGIDLALAQSAQRRAETAVSTGLGPESKSFKYTYETGGMTRGLAISGLRAREIADLWTSIVANIQNVGASPDLKQRIRAALPLWDAAHIDGEVHDLALRTAVVDAQVKAVGEKLTLTGLAKESAAELGVKIDGLAFKSAMLPSWAGELSPVSLSLDLRASDGGLGDAAGLALDDPHFGEKGGLAPETRGKIGAALLAGSPKLVLAPSRLTTPIVDLAFQGEAGVETGAPAGHFTVSANGLDKTVAFLEEVGKSRPDAGTLALGVVFLKGLATTEPDGRLFWKIDVSSAGKITVNGTPLPMEE